MFEEGDRVRIIEKDVIGEIIDVHTTANGEICYTVESENEGYIDDPDAWNIRFPQFICVAAQLERI